MLLICLIIQKRFEGTRVTIETFMAWKAKFDSELAELQHRKGKDDASNKKLTGTDDIIVDTVMTYRLSHNKMTQHRNHDNCVV